MDLRVQFHPARLPTRVFFAEWAALDGAVTRRDERTLETDRSVHTFLKSVENVIVGFEWEW